MKKWKCSLESIDEDIREVVRVLYQNNMKPYMSCSGSFKDHKGRQYVPQSANVDMLDSQVAREFMASLIRDKRFKCSIAKSRGCEFFGNHLPDGLRLKIQFENIRGNVQDELLKILQAVIHGQKAELSEKRKIDSICDLINSFDVKNGNEIEFSFNDERVKKEKEEDNYSITIRDRKDFCSLRDSLDGRIEGFMQNGYECRFFGNDYLLFLSVLERIQREYSSVPFLKRGQKKTQVATDRLDKFMMEYDKKAEQANEELEAAESKMMMGNTSIDLFDWLGFPGKDDN